MESQTKKIRIINKKTLIVAVDIGKTVHYGYFRAPTGENVRPFRFYNFKKSFEQFWAKICWFQRQHNLEDIVIGFESTGPYAEPLFHFLRQRPAKLRVIADVISLGHALTLVVPEGPAAQLRRLTQARERAMKSRTAMVNQLQHLVFVIFPEFFNIMKTLTKSAMHLIKNHTTPESIFAMGFKSLTGVLKKVSRGKLGQDRAKELFGAAQASIGIHEGKESIILEIDHLISKIENEDRFIDNLEKQMADHLRQIPYSSSLLSIKGIGIITAAGLIGEVGDFRKFRTISEMMKLAGLDLYEVSSGQHTGQRHISKRGRSLMRKLLFFAAINAVKSNGIMHEPYQQMLHRGMPKVKALIAISRKLLRIIFALARDNVEYVKNYNQIHHYKLAA
ncbi:MAG: IS110 family transposase [Deltaproteobacteria bacterium]|nr:IS110 family transposase [Deltaproteobacteria bacterium]